MFREHFSVDLISLDDRILDHQAHLMICTLILLRALDVDRRRCFRHTKGKFRFRHNFMMIPKVFRSIKYVGRNPPLRAAILRESIIWFFVTISGDVRLNWLFASPIMPPSGWYILGNVPLIVGNDECLCVLAYWRKFINVTKYGSFEM